MLDVCHTDVPNGKHITNSIVAQLGRKCLDHLSISSLLVIFSTVLELTHLPEPKFSRLAVESALLELWSIKPVHLFPTLWDIYGARLQRLDKTLWLTRTQQATEARVAASQLGSQLQHEGGEERAPRPGPGPLALLNNGPREQGLDFWKETTSERRDVRLRLQDLVNLVDSCLLQKPLASVYNLQHVFMMKRVLVRIA